MEPSGQALILSLSYRYGAPVEMAKVGSTAITTEENTTQLYEYPLSSPLPFQEGDTHQPLRQLGFHVISMNQNKPLMPIFMCSYAEIGSVGIRVA